MTNENNYNEYQYSALYKFGIKISTSSQIFCSAMIVIAFTLLSQHFTVAIARANVRDFSKW